MCSRLGKGFWVLGHGVRCKECGQKVTFYPSPSSCQGVLLESCEPSLSGPEGQRDCISVSDKARIWFAKDLCKSLAVNVCHMRINRSFMTSEYTPTIVHTAHIFKLDNTCKFFSLFIPGNMKFLCNVGHSTHQITNIPNLRSSQVFQ